MAGGLLLELKSWARFLLPGNKYLATYYATPPAVVSELLRFARVGPGDVVLDVGCGDGRVAIAAVAECGAARGVGIELDASLAAAAVQAARDAAVSDRVTILHGDAASPAAVAEAAQATVLTLYLSEKGNATLLRALRPALRPGTRVVSLAFGVEGWPRPDAVAVTQNGGVPMRLFTVGGRAGGGGGGSGSGGGGSSGGGGQAC
jgi:cyclopropane fatty-acyl-phospholipid synthase-like methyltransferase